MNILHHGARDGVTGSCHQLQANANSSLLIHFGLFPGRRGVCLRRGWF